jgi:hypothetical protein
LTHKQNWSDISEVHVRFAGGDFRSYGSLDEAVKAVGWTKISSCTGRGLGYIPERYIGHYYFPPTWGGDPVVFTDELGLRIPVAVVRDAALRLGLHYYRPYSRWYDRKRGKPIFTFRYDPVPGTRSRRGGGWHSYRKMQTQQEISAADFLDYDEEMIEYGITVRGRRSRRALPTWYDDIPEGRRAYQNWKQYRKHQWKE